MSTKSFSHPPSFCPWWKKDMDLELDIFLNKMIYESVSLKRDLMSKGISQPFSVI
jgi:hypothetical protein